MIRLTLSNLANQTLNYPDDGVRYTLKIYETSHGYLVDILIDDEPVILGQRLIYEFPLIPYQYREVGNFIVLNDFDTLSNAELVYLSAEELANARQDT